MALASTLAEPGLDVREPPRTLGATLRYLGPGLILSASIVGSP